VLLCEWQLILELIADTQEYKHILFRITALLVTSKAADRKLLYSLCRAPVQHFVETIMEAAIACWEWLLAARSDLRAQVFNFLFLWSNIVDINWNNTSVFVFIF